MKGLLTKDFLTLKKKYGIVRVIIDLAIIITLMIVLESAAPIYICFLLLPLRWPLVMKNGDGINLQYLYQLLKHPL